MSIEPEFHSTNSLTNFIQYMASSVSRITNTRKIPEIHISLPKCALFRVHSHKYASIHTCSELRKLREMAKAEKITPMWWIFLSVFHARHSSNRLLFGRSVVDSPTLSENRRAYNNNNLSQWQCIGVPLLCHANVFTCGIVAYTWNIGHTLEYIQHTHIKGKSTATNVHSNIPPTEAKRVNLWSNETGKIRKPIGARMCNIYSTTTNKTRHTQQT